MYNYTYVWRNSDKHAQAYLYVAIVINRISIFCEAVGVLWEERGNCQGVNTTFC